MNILCYSSYLSPYVFVSLFFLTTLWAFSRQEPYLFFIVSQYPAQANNKKCLRNDSMVTIALKQQQD